MGSKIIQYDRLSKLTADDLTGISTLQIVFDESDKDTIMATISVKLDSKLNTYVFSRCEVYDSLKEFSTVSMKELLTLFAKRQIISSDTSYYRRDDPKLHAFLSKLSYPGIEAVCENMEEFSTQFKSGKVSLKLPRGNTGEKTRMYKNQRVLPAKK